MKKNNFNEKIILSPFFTGFFVVIAMLIYYVICYIFSLNFGFFDIEKIGITETITYLFYGFSFGIACCCAKDYLNTPKESSFFALIFLWTAALFREMGIQHWLTTHDTVVTKTRFFLNPNNPFYEKIIAGFLMLLVLFVFTWILCKYFRQLLSGFFKFQTIPWTVAIFSLLTAITQIADRFPANYLKSTGTELAQHTIFILKILEEGGESLLPLLFAIALIQYHFIACKDHSIINSK